MAHLAHYEKPAPVWVDQLVRGRSPATYPGHGFVVFEVGEDATAYQAAISWGRYFALDAYEYAPLWTRVSDAALEARLLSEGVRYDTTVVLYGRDTTAAARAAVLPMYAGVDDVRILDGGFVAWSGRLSDRNDCDRPQPVTDFGKTFPGHPEYLMATEAVKTLIAERDAALVSVRSWAEYTGVTSGYSYIQPKGRIAGDVGVMRAQPPAHGPLS